MSKNVVWYPLLMLRATLAALAVSIPSFAQIVTGTIAGTVRDPSGLAVARAGVTLRQTTTGRERNTITSENGDFALAGLDAGSSTSRSPPPDSRSSNGEESTSPRR